MITAIPQLQLFCLCCSCNFPLQRRTNIYINANDVTSRNFSFSIILFFIKTKCIIRSFIFFFHQNKMYHPIIHIFCCIKDAQLFMLLYVNPKIFKNITFQMTQYYSYEEQLQIYS